MTPTEIAPQRVQRCAKDGFAMVLDVETARRSIEAGWPAVELWMCRMGHSHRVWPREGPRRDPTSPLPCGVCGLALPAKFNSYGGRRVHAGECTLLKGRLYRKFIAEHPGKVFILEEQSWYKGIHAPLSPPPPLDPLAGQMPKDWITGWARVHGYEIEEPAA